MSCFASCKPGGLGHPVKRNAVAAVAVAAAAADTSATK